MPATTLQIKVNAFDNFALVVNQCPSKAPFAITSLKGELKEDQNVKGKTKKKKKKSSGSKKRQQQQDEGDDEWENSSDDAEQQEKQEEKDAKETVSPQLELPVRSSPHPTHGMPMALLWCLHAEGKYVATIEAEGGEKEEVVEVSFQTRPGQFGDIPNFVNSFHLRSDDFITGCVNTQPTSWMLTLMDPRSTEQNVLLLEQLYYAGLFTLPSTSNPGLLMLPNGLKRYCIDLTELERDRLLHLPTAGQEPQTDASATSSMSKKQAKRLHKLECKRQGINPAPQPEHHNKEGEMKPPQHVDPQNDEGARNHSDPNNKHLHHYHHDHRSWCHNKKMKRCLKEEDLYIRINRDLVDSLLQCKKYHEELHDSTWITMELTTLMEMHRDLFAKEETSNATMSNDQTNTADKKGRQEKEKPSLKVKLIATELWKKNRTEEAGKDIHLATTLGFELGSLYHDFTMFTASREHSSYGNILTKLVGDALQRSGHTLWYWGNRVGYMSEYESSTVRRQELPSKTVQKKSSANHNGGACASGGSAGYGAVQLERRPFYQRWITDRDQQPVPTRSTLSTSHVHQAAPDDDDSPWAPGDLEGFLAAGFGLVPLVR